MDTFALNFQNRTTESHKIIRVAMEFWRSSSPTPDKVGSPGTGDTGTHPFGFGMSSEGETPCLPGQLFQCSVTLSVKQFFFVKVELLAF